MGNSISRGEITAQTTQNVQSLFNLVAGVVTLDGTKSDGSPFFHITDPTYDVHTYNGRDFYMWDCWYGSSLKIMEGKADKYFNE